MMELPRPSQTTLTKPRNVVLFQCVVVVAQQFSSATSLISSLASLSPHRFFCFCFCLCLRVCFLFCFWEMGSWRKQHGEGHRQMGHWSGSSSSLSNNRKPPLGKCIWKPTVPRWEKMFCASVGSVSWENLVEAKKYIYLYDNVMNWDDSAVKEAFDNAKKRFWAKINGLPCDISLPDPDIYIDDIDWNSSVDPELILDLERNATTLSEEEKDKEVVILDSSLLLNQSFSCSGWGEAEEDTPKPIDLVYGAQVNLHESNMVGPWEQYWTPDAAAAKTWEWQNNWNDSWGWNQSQYYWSDTQKMGRGAGWNRGTWYGYTRKEENISWYQAPAYHHGDEYRMSRGRRNNRGRGGNFAHDHPCVNNIPKAR
ncbi:uncharacterized protein LOC133307945 isoform X2 [Gastrolobium bilobum]|uniref:uncharacterized protein LOC133307945 isoform X2 n=1 Tax=Gastrolobium bilobum TaxID=150636 RepID=UPI002AB2E372|nr:uncharacterized protein LOC133307945 isoform X2 [Gastrolobium bilobum]